jgi:hypothetical protein
MLSSRLLQVVTVNSGNGRNGSQMRPCGSKNVGWATYERDLAQQKLKDDFGTLRSSRFAARSHNHSRRSVTVGSSDELPGSLCCGQHPDRFYTMNRRVQTPQQR